jgi:hypothetical protein
MLLTEHAPPCAQHRRRAASRPRKSTVLGPERGATRVLSKMPPSAPPEHSFSPATGQPGDHSCRRQQDLAPLGPRCIPQRFARVEVEPIQTERTFTVGRGLRQSHSGNSVSPLQTLSPAHKCAHAPTLLPPRSSPLSTHPPIFRRKRCTVRRVGSASSSTCWASSSRSSVLVQSGWSAR